MHQKEVKNEEATVLSKQAIDDLRSCLNNEIGLSYTSLLSDEELEKIGMLFLTTMAISLKSRCL